MGKQLPGTKELSFSSSNIIVLALAEKYKWSNIINIHCYRILGLGSHLLRKVSPKNTNKKLIIYKVIIQAALGISGLAICKTDLRRWKTRENSKGRQNFSLIKEFFYGNGVLGFQISQEHNPSKSKGRLNTNFFAHQKLTIHAIQFFIR